MQTNPIVMLIQAMRNGGDPMQMIQSMAGGDPRVQQALQMARGKDAHQLQQIAQTIATNNGVDLRQMINSMGLKM